MEFSSPIRRHIDIFAVTNPGDRTYMEDCANVSFIKKPNETDVLFTFFGVFDGHGGTEAAKFACENLLSHILKQQGFWSEKSETVQSAIYDGILTTHASMWNDHETWSKRYRNFPSTAGTTASIGILKNRTMYIGHVGDSAVVLGYEATPGSPWQAKKLTAEHKPDSPKELRRIQRAGGKVTIKNGISRVCWRKPQEGHLGPIRTSTKYKDVPFLAIGRSLGDFWSYNAETEKFIVSPEPDILAFSWNLISHKCLIFGTDGLWDVVSPQEAVNIVYKTQNSNHGFNSENSSSHSSHINLRSCSRLLVDIAVCRWRAKNLRADNVSVVTVLVKKST